MIERSFGIDDLDYEKMKEISKRENIPISVLVRTAIRRLLKEYEDDVDFVEIVSNR